MPSTQEHPLIDRLDELAASDTQVILHELNQRALLVDLTVSQWEGRHQISGAEVLVGGKALPKNLTSQSHWVLRPKKWSERFNQMAGVLRGFMAPKIQPKRGVDIIALQDAPRIFGAVKEYRKSTWEPAVEEFIADWPSLASGIKIDLIRHFKDKDVSLEEATKAADQVYEQLFPHIPTRAKLRSKFSVVLEVFPLGDSVAAVRDTLTGEHAAEFVEEMEQATKSFASKVMLEIMAQPLEEAAAVAASIVQKAGDGKGGLREESLGVMRRSLEKIKSFSDFVARPKLLEAITKAEQSLSGYNHEELNSALRNKTAVASALGVAFQEIADQVELAQSTVKAFGRKIRHIEV